jgi:curli biogenesis system outer membrane secretion channel CsgG
MRRLALGLSLQLACLTAACGGGTANSGVNHAPQSARSASCARLFEDVDVVAFQNKTEQDLNLSGGSDLLLSAVTGTGCVTAVERERFSDLTREMDLCDEKNPNREYMDCSSVAQKGNVQGAKFKLFGILDYAGQLSAAKLQAKIPGIGGLQWGHDYVALLMTFRIVETATGKVVSLAQGEAHVIAQEAGVSFEGGGFSFKAEIESRRPLGVALRDMLEDVAGRLVQPNQSGT